MAINRKLFVNIAVRDLEASIQFFTKLGFTFDQRFTDETATCMIVGEDAYFMIITEQRFKDFTKKTIADASSQTEAIYALAVEDRDEVDRFVDIALANGGTPANEPNDMGFMYTRSFNDPDGHLWEIFYLDMSSMPG